MSSASGYFLRSIYVSVLQIAAMRENMESSNTNFQEEMNKLRQEAEDQRKQLEQDMLKSAEEYMHKIKAMEAMHEDSVRKVNEQRIQELEVGLFLWLHA